MIYKSSNLKIKKIIQRKIKENNLKPGLVASYDIQHRNQMGLFLKGKDKGELNKKSKYNIYRNRK